MHITIIFWAGAHKLNRIMHIVVQLVGEKLAKSCQNRRSRPQVSFVFTFEFIYYFFFVSELRWNWIRVTLELGLSMLKFLRAFLRLNLHPAQRWIAFFVANFRTCGRLRCFISLCYNRNCVLSLIFNSHIPSSLTHLFTLTHTLLASSPPSLSSPPLSLPHAHTPPSSSSTRRRVTIIILPRPHTPLPGSSSPLTVAGNFRFHFIMINRGTPLALTCRPPRHKNFRLH